jgi:hypothetical protein
MIAANHNGVTFRYKDCRHGDRRWRPRGERGVRQSRRS